MSERRAVAIFGSSATDPGSRDWHDAEMAGTRFARAGLTVITGGYGGTMEAASKGAASAGGRVIGVTAPDLFPRRSGANPYVTEEVESPTLTERIGRLTSLANGAIVLPGSIGTAAELLIVWNTNHIARGKRGTRFPTVAVGDHWRELWELMTSGLGAVGDDIHLAATADEGVDWLLAQPEID